MTYDEMLIEREMAECDCEREWWDLWLWEEEFEWE